ncbi:hypothetical protein MNBD_BACTEROID01-2512 [hydrothermal vent metagenome]|uniref:Uncharacterized protein n=1 Tax=hydrothermal vent metagenome TaxID=652676 RepID=A0A3B0U2Y5_9ZZZZ
MKKNVFKIGALLIPLIAVLMLSCNCSRKDKAIQGESGSIIRDSLRYKKPVFDSVIIEKDICFAELTTNKGSLEKFCLDVYTPYGDEETNRPAILWVHGGGFRAGDKTQGYIVTLANEFAKRGYVSISADYRLRGNPKEDMEGTLNDAVSDVMMALGWVRENSEKYGINKNYIAIGGGSAGGILSTNLCYKDATSTEEWDKSGVIAFINLWGSPSKERMDKIIDKNDPPTLLIHGMADSVVPFSNCEWLVNALDSAGVRFSVFPIPGAGHTPVGHIGDIVERIQKFLYGILSGD